MNIASTGLIVVGTVVGGLTASPAILGSISGAGLVLKTFSEGKNYKRKIEMARTSLREATFNKDDSLKEMTVLDETIVDFAPLVIKFEKQYAKKFLFCPTETVKQHGGQFETTTSSPGPLAQ